MPLTILLSFSYIFYSLNKNMVSEHQITGHISIFQSSLVSDMSHVFQVHVVFVISEFVPDWPFGLEKCLLNSILCFCQIHVDRQGACVEEIILKGITL